MIEAPTLLTMDCKSGKGFPGGTFGRPRKVREAPGFVREIREASRDLTQRRGILLLTGAFQQH